MAKIKKDLVSNKKSLPTKSESPKLKGKVDDLAPKAKNLPQNIKEQSGKVEQKRKIGEITHVELDDRLKIKKK